MSSAPWPFIGCVVLVLLGAPSTGGSRPDAGQTVVVRRGHFLLGDAETPPPGDDPRWREIALPDLWSSTRPGVEGAGWYRFELPALAGLGEPSAVYLPDLNMTASVWLNGERVARCGSFEEPVSHCWNYPLYAPVASSLLSGGPNTLHVRLFTYPPYGGLGVIQLGPASVLKPRYDRKLTLQVGIPRTFTALAMLVVCFMLAFWLGSRDPVYAWFGLFTFFWGVAMLNNHVREIPVSHDTWEWIVHVSFDWMAVAGVRVVHHLFGLRRPRVERGVLAFGIAAAVVGALTPRSHFHTVINVFHAAALAFAAYAWCALFYAARRVTRTQAAAFALTILVVAIGVHDLLIQLDYLPMSEPHYFVFVAPVTTLAFAIMLTVRFVQTFESARRLNVELESRVREKRLELEESFARMRDLENQRVRASERERLMREVHDGLGGQLVSALAMVQQGDARRDDVADALRSSIDEMRLVIDSLDPLIDDLATLLGTLRGRLEPRLRRQGLRFEWRVAPLPPVPRLGPQDLLHVLRIVQEAITNVLKHARARVVTVTTAVRSRDGSGESVFIEVRDDGVGLSEACASGRGFANMLRRAAQIGAELVLEPAPGAGTRVQLWIPLRAADPRSSAPFLPA